MDFGTLTSTHPFFEQELTQKEFKTKLRDQHTKQQIKELYKKYEEYRNLKEELDTMMERKKMNLEQVIDIYRKYSFKEFLKQSVSSEKETLKTSSAVMGLRQLQKAIGAHIEISKAIKNLDELNLPQPTAKQSPETFYENFIKEYLNLLYTQNGPALIAHLTNIQSRWLHTFPGTEEFWEMLLVDNDYITVASQEVKDYASDLTQNPEPIVLLIYKQMEEKIREDYQKMLKESETYTAFFNALYSLIHYTKAWTKDELDNNYKQITTQQILELYKQFKQKTIETKYTSTQLKEYFDKLYTELINEFDGYFTSQRFNYQGQYTSR